MTHSTPPAGFALLLAAAAAVPTGLAGTRASRPACPGVSERIVRFVDRARVVQLRDGTTRPRVLVTVVRYPAAARRAPFPLIVFGHGFALTPAPYAPLLCFWARAGYVVAAPVFPLENAAAPGGPDEADLVNQPGDVSFVISRLLAAHSTADSPFGRLIDPARVAVAGHSDGGETAFAVGYERDDRDRRVRAVLVLSGAVLPGAGAPVTGGQSPPLLATQGTADRINPMSLTRQFYDLVRRPKFLLTLPGAGHLPPYTEDTQQFRAVVQVTTAFLDHYLKQAPLSRLLAAGRRPGVATLAGTP